MLREGPDQSRRLEITVLPPSWQEQGLARRENNSSVALRRNECTGRVYGTLMAFRAQQRAPGLRLCSHDQPETEPSFLQFAPGSIKVKSCEKADVLCCCQKSARVSGMRGEGSLRCGSCFSRIFTGAYPLTRDSCPKDCSKKSSKEEHSKHCGED
jgi:hypothetical protein